MDYFNLALELSRGQARRVTEPLVQESQPRESPANNDKDDDGA